MAAPRAERRLAAILVADVVGYSRLVERDEAGSLERLKSHRAGAPLEDAHNCPPGLLPGITLRDDGA